MASSRLSTSYALNNDKMNPRIVFVMLLTSVGLPTVSAWSSKQVCRNQKEPWLGKNCAGDTDCPAAIHAVCLEGSCRCRPGFVYSDETNMCPKLTWLEKNCASSDDCPNDVNATCFSDKCLCNHGYFYSTAKNLCVPTCDTADRLTTYTKYPDHAFSGSALFVAASQTAEECVQSCNVRDDCVAVVAPSRGQGDCNGYANAASATVPTGFTDIYVKRCA